MSRDNAWDSILTCETTNGLEPTRRARVRIAWSKLLITVLILAVLALASVGLRGWLAKGELEQAQGLVDVAQQQLEDGDYGALTETFEQVREHTQRARTYASGPAWRAAEHLPRFGPNLRALRGMTEVVDDALDAAAPSVALAPMFTREGLAPQGGHVPLEPFRRAAEEVPPFAAEMARLSDRLDRVSTTGTVAPLQDAKGRLTEAFDEATERLDEAAPVAAYMPAILGDGGARRYVVMFQNNAELRSLGGTALSFSEISVDDGEIQLVRTVPAGLEEFPFREEPVVPLPAGFEDLYSRSDGYFIADATMRPSGDTAARIVQAEWESKYGDKVDGVISMDGPALSGLMAATGPVTLSTGDEVSSENVVPLLFNEVYLRYNTGDLLADNLAQNRVYAETVEQTFGRLSSGEFDPLTLVRSLRSAASNGSFTVWLDEQDERAALSSTTFGASGVPAGTDDTDVVGLYLNDQVGSKLDYYLNASVTTASAACAAGDRQVYRATMSLTNTVPTSQVPSLSPSITGGDYRRIGLDKAEQRFAVFVYLPEGATLLGAQVNGESVAPTGQTDEGHPVQVLWVRVKPGATSTLSVDVLAPSLGERELEVDVTPTLSGVSRSSMPLDCSTVALP